MISSILSEYGIAARDPDATLLTSGLINKTWKISDGNDAYILQRINVNVFKRPEEMAENISMIADYLKAHAPDYLFASPVRTLTGATLISNSDGYFRLFPYINGSHTIEVVDHASGAYEAARQFGKFTRQLAGFDATRLYITIPDFHNLSYRYSNFETALHCGNAARVKESSTLIQAIHDRRDILTTYEKILRNSQVRKRVTHHDTKISNVLLDDQGKGICVIDLDTVMPGYFISDVGDMLRTYLSPANEEEKDFSKIEIREDFFRAIVQGYLSCMADELTAEEKSLIIYSGSFLIYMQAVRFLTDYLNNDIYYGSAYPGQNFVRAGNQIALLQRLDELSPRLKAILSNEVQGPVNYFFS